MPVTRAMAMKMEEMLKQLLEMMQDYNTELKKSQEDVKTILKNSYEDMKTILKDSKGTFRNSLKAMRNSQGIMKTELKIEVKVDQSQLESTKDEVKDEKKIKNEAEDRHEELKMEMRNMKENFVQFSTSDVINVDGSGTSFLKIQTPTFDEITYGGNNEEEVTILGNQKIDCGRRIQDREEELEELVGQVQPLEQAKFRLEMTLESMKKEVKKKTRVKNEELEDVWCNAKNKVKALEAPLNHAHEERTLLRDNHELGRRLSAAAEPERDNRLDDEVLLHGLERDLKLMKASLRDMQTQLDRKKAKPPGKAALRQLRNQLEDEKCSSTLTVKGNQARTVSCISTV